eukprot:TRINITY_DN997_c0_g1_i1.p1 TRINITY_DN997_c0_g1~~TRINITY_DN997_c0_g1_i1.p1  ORF type:complete len:125 (+),score=20.61 TRINITY_DN997_c0_g1_i1:5-379(+)
MMPSSRHDESKNDHEKNSSGTGKNAEKRSNAKLNRENEKIERNTAPSEDPRNLASRRFNSKEAAKNLSETWIQVQNQLHDSSMSSEQKPVTFRSPAWGQTKHNLTFDFLSDLQKSVVQLQSSRE